MDRIVDLIIAKRDGRALPPEDVEALVDAYTRGDVPDYQMSAFLMAAFLRGLDDRETYALTHAMLHSGRVVDLSAIPGVKVDKHSTGGVGDKISLVLAPLVAACGVVVPMISGRGLGHTGGTLDKLEAIPGFRVDLTTEAYVRQLSGLGMALIGQTDDIAPADRALYALRDVTGTVEFIPFIASSIMSKKLAEGIDALVLDVKCGRGAFMKTEDEARRLAETLVHVGERFGKRTVAWLTNMDEPLGYAIGNWPETAEAIRCLHGEEVPEVTELVCALAGEMLYLGDEAATPEEGVERARAVLASGEAVDQFAAIVEAQGGDASVVHDPASRTDIPEPVAVYAPEGASGYVEAIDALALGKLAVRLGAGRFRKEDDVDPTAGLVLAKKRGDAVRPGDVLAHIYTRRTHQAAVFTTAAAQAFTYAEAVPATSPLLLDRFTEAGWDGGRKPGAER